VSYRRTLASLLCGAALSAPAAGQTTDAVFAGWSWAPEGLGSRPAGLGGAFVAVADGNDAAYANPAGLALIPAWEVGAFSGRTWVGAAGGGVPWVRLGTYATETSAAHVERGGAEGPATARAVMDSSVWEGGIGFGAEPVRRLRIGASLAWSRLRLDAERTVKDAAGQPIAATTVRSDDAHLRVTAGVLITLVGPQRRSLPSLRLGIAYQPGFDWSAELARAGGPDAGTTTVGLRRPTLVMVGLAWRPTDRWLFAAEGDVIRYGEVVASLRRNVGGDAPGFRLPSTVEPRFGGEFSAPMFCGCGIGKVRAGIHYASPGTLRFQGDDPVTAAAFANPGWRVVTTLGVSFLTEFFDHAVRLDLDSKDLFHGPALSFGIVWRF
jgi:hypothetical protein